MQFQSHRLFDISEIGTGQSTSKVKKLKQKQDMKEQQKNLTKDYPIYELVFAQSLGINLKSPMECLHLLPAASLSLYQLPEGYEICVGSGEHENLPYFYNNTTGESFWHHPCETQIKSELCRIIEEENIVAFVPDMDVVNPVEAKSSSQSSTTRYELYEILFALGFRVDPSKEGHNKFLMPIIHKMLHSLPSEIELFVGEGAYESFPFFYDSTLNVSSWIHPYDSKIRDAITNLVSTIGLRFLSEEEYEEMYCTTPLKTIEVVDVSVSQLEAISIVGKAKDRIHSISQDSAAEAMNVPGKLIFLSNRPVKRSTSSVLPPPGISEIYLPVKKPIVELRSTESKEVQETKESKTDDSETQSPNKPAIVPDLHLSNPQGSVKARRGLSKLTTESITPTTRRTPLSSNMSGSSYWTYGSESSYSSYSYYDDSYTGRDTIYSSDSYSDYSSAPQSSRSRRLRWESESPYSTTSSMSYSPGSSRASSKFSYFSKDGIASPNPNRPLSARLKLLSPLTKTPKHRQDDLSTIISVGSETESADYSHSKNIAMTSNVPPIQESVEMVQEDEIPIPNIQQSTLLDAGDVLSDSKSKVHKVSVPTALDNRSVSPLSNETIDPQFQASMSASLDDLSISKDHAFDKPVDAQLAVCIEATTIPDESNSRSTKSKTTHTKAVSSVSPAATKAFVSFAENKVAPAAKTKVRDSENVALPMQTRKTSVPSLVKDMTSGQASHQPSTVASAVAAVASERSVSATRRPPKALVGKKSKISSAESKRTGSAENKRTNSRSRIASTRLNDIESSRAVSRGSQRTNSANSERSGSRRPLSRENKRKDINVGAMPTKPPRYPSPNPLKRRLSGKQTVTKNRPKSASKISKKEKRTLSISCDTQTGPSLIEINGIDLDNELNDVLVDTVGERNDVSLLEIPTASTTQLNIITADDESKYSQAAKPDLSDKSAVSAEISSLNLAAQTSNIAPVVLVAENQLLDSSNGLVAVATIEAVEESSQPERIETPQKSVQSPSRIDTTTESKQSNIALTTVESSDVEGCALVEIRANGEDINTDPQHVVQNETFFTEPLVVNQMVDGEVAPHLAEALAEERKHQSLNEYPADTSVPQTLGDQLTDIIAPESCTDNTADIAVSELLVDNPSEPQRLVDNLTVFVSQSSDDKPIDPSMLIPTSEDCSFVEAIQSSSLEETSYFESSVTGDSVFTSSRMDSLADYDDLATLGSLGIQALEGNSLVEYTSASKAPISARSTESKKGLKLASPSRRISSPKPKNQIKSPIASTKKSSKHSQLPVEEKVPLSDSTHEPGNSNLQVVMIESPVKVEEPACAEIVINTSESSALLKDSDHHLSSATDGTPSNQSKSLNLLSKDATPTKREDSPKQTLRANASFQQETPAMLTPTPNITQTEDNMSSPTIVEILPKISTPDEGAHSSVDAGPANLNSPEKIITQTEISATPTKQASPPKVVAPSERPETPSNLASTPLKIDTPGERHETPAKQSSPPSNTYPSEIPATTEQVTLPKTDPTSENLGTSNIAFTPPKIATQTEIITNMKLPMSSERATSNEVDLSSVMSTERVGDITNASTPPTIELNCNMSSDKDSSQLHFDKVDEGVIQTSVSDASRDADNDDQPIPDPIRIDANPDVQSTEILKSTSLIASQHQEMSDLEKSSKLDSHMINKYAPNADLFLMDLSNNTQVLDTVSVALTDTLDEDSPKKSNPTILSSLHSVGQSRTKQEQKPKSNTGKVKQVKEQRRRIENVSARAAPRDDSPSVKQNSQSRLKKIPSTNSVSAVQTAQSTPLSQTQLADAPGQQPLLSMSPEPIQSQPDTKESSMPPASENAPETVQSVVILPDEFVQLTRPRRPSELLTNLMSPIVSSENTEKSSLGSRRSTSKSRREASPAFALASAAAAAALESKVEEYVPQSWGTLPPISQPFLDAPDPQTSEKISVAVPETSAKKLKKSPETKKVVKLPSLPEPVPQQPQSEDLRQIFLAREVRIPRKTSLRSSQLLLSKSLEAIKLPPLPEADKPGSRGLSRNSQRQGTHPNQRPASPAYVAQAYEAWKTLARCSSLASAKALRTRLLRHVQALGKHAFLENSDFNETLVTANSQAQLSSSTLTKLDMIHLVYGGKLELESLVRVRFDECEGRSGKWLVEASSSYLCRIFFEMDAELGDEHSKSSLDKGALLDELLSKARKLLGKELHSQIPSYIEAALSGNPVNKAQDIVFLNPASAQELSVMSEEAQDNTLQGACVGAI